MHGARREWRSPQIGWFILFRKDINKHMLSTLTVFVAFPYSTINLYNLIEPDIKNDKFLNWSNSIGAGLAP